MDNLTCSQLATQVKELACEQSHVVNNRDDLDSHYVDSLCDSFNTIIEVCSGGMKDNLVVMEMLAPKFDLDEQTKGNGFRSVLHVVKTCLLRIMELVNHIMSYHYQTTVFKTRNPVKDLQAFAQALWGLEKAVNFLISHRAHFEHTDDLIIAMNTLDEQDRVKLYDAFEDLPRSVFYGRTIAFHYESTLTHPFTAISVSMLSYAELFEKESLSLTSMATTFISGGKYLVNNKLRGYCMAHLSRYCDISFGKAFWSLTEINMFQHVPSIVCNSVEINRVLELEETPILLKTVDGGDGRDFTCPFPQQKVKTEPLAVRVMSFVQREGMHDLSASSSGGGGGGGGSLKNKKKTVSPLADAIIVHIHGGGFISQSSKSHEIYLRSWAKYLNVPIVSIDYSLAPDNSFPVAVEQCFYSYCWVLANLYKLGCKPDARICVVGDSAGGNLTLTVALKCIQNKIRKPDGLVPIYPATFPQYALSPSRVLSIMDCLLAVGILDQCLLAYLGEEDPLPGFKVSRVLEQYQDEWEYGGEGERPFATSLVPSLNALACGSWLYRLVRRPNDRPPNSPEASQSIADYKLEMVEDEQWMSISVKRDGVEVENKDVKFELSSDEENDAEKTPNSERKVATNQAKGSSELLSSERKCDPGTSSSVHSNHSWSILPLSWSKRRQVGSFKLMRNLKEKKRVASPESLSKSSSSPSLDTVHLHPGPLERIAGSENSSKSALARSGDLVHVPADVLPKDVHVKDEAAAAVAPTGSRQQQSAVACAGSVPYEQFAAKCKLRKKEALLRTVCSPHTQNPLYCPLVASDEELAAMPPVHLVVGAIDPLLDETIMYAKRLKAVNHVVTLDVLDSLPHGFLNFVLISKPCREASDVCVTRIKHVITARNTPNVETEV